MPIISDILTRKIPLFIDLVVWFLGLKIRTNLGEMEGKYKDKKKNWRNYIMIKQGEEN